MSISRVHALVVALAGRVAIIDAASTNGLYTEGGDEPVRVAYLDAGASVTLGQGGPVVRWR